LRLTDKDLADSTARSETENIFPDSGITSHKVQSSLELARVTSDVHAKPLSETCRDQPRADDQVGTRDNSAHDVVGAHHLRARVRSECLEDMVLSAVCQAIKKEVDTQQQQAPCCACIVRPDLAALLLSRVQREDSHAESHGRNHEILVQRISTAKDSDVKEHDR
jgi:hypothetical protein